jgi:hypothetical protein
MSTTADQATQAESRPDATDAATMPLSSTQRYFLDVIVDEGFDPSWQHICLTLRLDGRLDAERFQDAVAALGERHPILASRLGYVNGEPRLARAEDHGAASEFTVLEGADLRELDLWSSRRADAPFDVLTGPLWRVAAVSDGDGVTLLSFIGHHLVSDGMSSWTLVRDFGAVYSGGELAPAPPAYHEFVAEQEAFAATPEFDRRLEYWEDLLAGGRARIEFADRPSRDELGSGQTAPLRLGPGSGAGLIARARARRVTPLALLSDATFTAVREATGHDGLLAAVVTDIRGARYADTVGAFSDLMLIRDPVGSPANGQEPLARLRNDFFRSWKAHLPIGRLRSRVSALAGTAGNPCDLFLNFIPVRTSSDWFALLGPYGGLNPAYHALGHRIGSPSRRFHAPLYFVSFVHAMELEGWVAMQRNPGLRELNTRVAAALERTTTAATAPAD